MATPATQPDPTQDNEIQQPIEGPIPNPVETLSTAAKTITGGGITKSEETGTDRLYRTPEGDIKSTGEAAALSVEQQQQQISPEEFRERIRTGQIPTVAKIEKGVLQNSVELLGMEGVSPEHKQLADQRLNGAYELYMMQQQAPSTPIPFGQEVGEGEYQFAPTAEAKQNPKQLTVERNIFEGKKAVAQVVNGAFGDKLGLARDDQTIIENIFVRNISTGSFWDTLVEKVNEGAIRGTAIYLPDMVLNYGLHAIEAAAATAVTYLTPLNNRGFMEQWEDTADQRQATSQWWKGVLADNLAVKELSVVMNEMVANDLKNQLDAGAIDEETYNRLTKSTITTPEGQQITVENQFINEEMAQTLLNTSIDQLSDSEQYGLVLAEAAMAMIGVGKMKSAAGDKQIATISRRVEEITARAAKPDATDAEIVRAAKFKGLSPLQQGRILSMEGDIDKINEKAILYAMGMDRATGNIKRLSTSRNDVSKRMQEYRAAGKNTKAAEYRALEAEKRRLDGMTVKTYLTGRFIPNVKENFIEAAPLSLAMYYGGESETMQAWFEGDRLAAEGMSALGYMFIGKPAATLAGKGAYWVNQQGGDIVNKSLGMVEAIANIPFKLVGRDVVKGYLRDNSIENFEKAYIAATGNRLDRQTRVALDMVGRVAGALDDDGLEQVVSSMEKHQDRLASLVKAFPANEQVEMQGMLKESLAMTSSIGWLQSANKLAGFSVDARDAGSLKNMSDQLQAQRLIQQQASATMRLVQNLRAKVADRTDLTDPEEVSRYIDSLEAGIQKHLEQLNTDKALLNKQINEFKSGIIQDPTTELPAGVLDSLDDMEMELALSLNPDLDEMQIINRQFQENSQALATRAENISLLRNNDVSHIKQTARSLEMMVHNRFARMRKRAKRGFVQVDKRAAEMGASISVNKMITELMSYAPDGDKEISRFFSKNSRFFVGTLGKRMYTVANRMARRSLESLEGSGYDELYRLHTNPNAGEYFLGENPRPLDIMLFYMERGEGPEFLATPGEVMDVYSAFRDYAVRIGDEGLASRYRDYAGAVEDTVKEQARELFNEWKEARTIYQAEWFDKLRMGGPLTKLHKSQNGPVKAVNKLDESGESFWFDDVAIGEEIPEGTASDRLFKVAYKGATPMDVFDPMVKNINGALRGDDEALNTLVKFRDQFIQEFSDEPIGEVFDLTNEASLADFNLLKSNLTELVYAKWGRGVAKQLGERADLDIDAIRTGGYNFDKIDNVAEVQEALTVAVRGPDGKTRRVKLVDMDRMIEEERSIEKLVRESNEMAANMTKYQGRVLRDVETVQAKLIADSQVRDEGIRAITKAIGADNPRSFFEKYVINGTVGGIDRVRDAVRGKLGDSFTIDGKQYDTNEALDRGITYMIINGMLDHGGLAPVAGRKSMGSNGKTYTTQAMYNPENITDALDKENVQQILSEFIDQEHQSYLFEMADYLSDNVAVAAGALDTMPKIENVVRPMNVNQLISRGFNLARGMVSPQYVAAELGVSLATQAGLDMMKLAAGNKEAADLMLQLVKNPKNMTKADLDTFDNLVTTFVVTELGQLGDAGRDIITDITTPPEGDKD